MVHPTALISTEAEIDPSAEVGAYAIIEGPVKIGAGCKIAPHAQIVGDTIIGDGTTIGRGAVVGETPQDIGFTSATKSGVRIGRNNVIREHVTIHRGSKDGGLTEIGDNNFLMAGSHLGHDVKLGNRSILANAVLVAGHVHIGNNTFMGGGAVFHQFIRIGDFCVVQGNGSFSRDIPHYCSALRVNRLSGLNVIGLRRQGFSPEDRAGIKDLFNLVFRSGHNLSQALTAAREQSWSEHAARLLAFLEAPSKKGVCTLSLRHEADE
ncbi:acyl-[acyl-carrier-protein]--UDP-N-acetylglucosamine O-acyltransferase [Roseimicrobium gellanilyticum]|uniref:Acyl-[acyl-carrier-protein]--UDP-N-acetylglucosamine O-acyltransferase n=1 Tax=Roseimicrobium gellanilyticum TaxID=748857 RepID=A0A366HHV1_9BACT|nr:acyl-ACP--UDP-N-acetylglucosamine O-acyltransferase [Roseimicrobium gellanilyticum]RBP41496.1 acyl-[acyl-carrier-protein]--UDP-N-acetylglucosamine O-acyltransferase [Roseimicrobium gellanilyticum]